MVPDDTITIPASPAEAATPNRLEALQDFLAAFPPALWRAEADTVDCGPLELVASGVDLPCDQAAAAIRLFAAAPAMLAALVKVLDGTVARINTNLTAFEYDRWQPGDALPDLSELKERLRLSLEARMAEANAMHAALVAAGART